MANAGCTGEFVGLETLTDANLKDAKKKTPSPEDYARRVQIFHQNQIQVNGSFVFGFDHDGPDVFERTVNWVEENHLECATYHILTPYPGTPLFRQMEAEGRLLHREWSRYDTAHVVFQPKHMTPEELMQGYEWAYKRTFSWNSIWKRLPEVGGVMSTVSHLGMSLLYKKSNWLWPFLIRNQLTHLVWKPLVHASRFKKQYSRKPQIAAT